MSKKTAFEKAVQAFQAGRFAESLELAGRLLKAKRPDSQVLELAGTAAVQIGRLDEARGHYRRLTKRHPDKASFWSALGYIEFGLRAFEDAARAYGEAAALEPKSIDHAYFQALSLAELGAFAAAAAGFEAILAAKPDHPGVLRALSNLRRQQGRALEAMPLMRKALAVDRNVDAATWVDYAEAAIGVLDIPEVHRAIETAEPAMRNDAESLARGAQVLTRLGKSAEARKAIERALSVRPNDPEILNDAATVENDAGNFEGAWAYYRRIIEGHPDVAKAYFGICRLRTFSTSNSEDMNLLAKMEAALAAVPDDPPFLDYALGKVYADLGDYDASFRHLKKANDARRRERPYNREEDRQRAAFCIDRFPSGEVFPATALPPDDGVSPIFIVGMPRSGTTLVEQIIGAHPEVTACGELPLMPYIVTDLYRNGLNSASKDALRAAGRLFRERVGHLAAGRWRVTDKLPHNIFNVGEIRSMLPDAKVIMMRRDGGDAGLSCYTTPFRRGLDFSNDLADIGYMFRLVEQLERHWREVLPDDVLAVDYEKLVDEPEAQIGRVLAFCGLPWNDACLSFNEYQRRVGTASFVQVKKPMYRTSVAKWRRYEAHLGPLLEALKEDSG